MTDLHMGAIVGNGLPVCEKCEKRKAEKSGSDSEIMRKAHDKAR
jgi:hypothetical protein